jgi:hypothetical protein
VTRIVLVLTFVLTITLPGCKAPQVVQERPELAQTAAKAAGAGASIQKAATRATASLDTAAATVSESAGVVSAQADTLRKATPAAEPVARTLDAQAALLQTKALPQIQEAKEDVVQIQQAAAVVVSQVAPEIRQADLDVKAISKERDDAKVAAAAAEKQVEEERAKAASTTQTILTWMILVGVLCVAGGAVLAIKGNLKAGLSICGGGLVLIGLCTFMKEYLDWIVWGSVALVAAVIAGVIYLLWQSRKAFFQTGNLVEAIKQQMDPESLKTVFGDGAVPGMVHQIVGDAQTALYKVGVETGLIKTKGATPAVAGDPKEAKV